MPTTGITLTAVVLLFITPIAASSAIMADMVSFGVSPGMAIMSSPTEQTDVMASNLSKLKHPDLTADIMPSSSETGMKAPDSPPTWDDAMMPPFFTASFSRARAAVVPWPPTVSIPISSSILATESPTAGVGARDRSIMPKFVSSLFDTSLPTSSPILEILKDVFLIVSATSSKLFPLTFSRAFFTTPGPEMPTLIVVSDSPTPWKAPAMNGLSSTAFANTTNFAQPIESWSFVFSASSFIFPPIIATASMLMPVLLEPTFTDEQT